MSAERRRSAKSGHVRGNRCARRGDAPELTAAQRLLEPPNPGMAAACCIHDASWRSSRSSNDASSTPREALPMPIGVTGGSGVSDVPRPNVTLTWPANPPHAKHQPSPTAAFAGLALPVMATGSDVRTVPEPPSVVSRCFPIAA